MIILSTSLELCYVLNICRGTFTIFLGGHDLRLYIEHRGITDEVFELTEIIILEYNVTLLIYCVTKGGRKPPTA